LSEGQCILVGVQVALLDGEPVVAFDLDQADFAVLKTRSRSSPGCLRFSDGLVAIPRSGTSVGQHFSHKPGEGGTTEPETIHHIEAKRAVRDVARARGWDAQIEARDPEGLWVADVLLTRGATKVAFEVQWSPQTVDDYVARTERYGRSGVQVVWLAKYTSRTWWDIERSVPAIPFKADGIGISPVRPLALAINACLEQLEAPAIPPNSSTVRKETCYRCGEPFGYHNRDPLWEDKQQFTPDEAAALGRWAATRQKRYSKPARKEYLAWHCPHCRAMQGDFHLHGEPFAVVGQRLLPDTRGKTFWWIIEDLLYK